MPRQTTVTVSLQCDPYEAALVVQLYNLLRSREDCPDRAAAIEQIAQDRFMQLKTEIDGMFPDFVAEALGEQDDRDLSRTRDC
jgi:hypothetical protein